MWLSFNLRHKKTCFFFPFAAYVCSWSQTCSWCLRVGALTFITDSKKPRSIISLSVQPRSICLHFPFTDLYNDVLSFMRSLHLFSSWKSLETVHGEKKESKMPCWTKLKSILASCMTQCVLQLTPIFSCAFVCAVRHLLKHLNDILQQKKYNSQTMAESALCLST